MDENTLMTNLIRGAMFGALLIAMPTLKRFWRYTWNLVKQSGKRGSSK